MADNRRVRMTKKLIKDAYLELLETNPSEKISVTDICRKADVNRSTFYMYYEDPITLRQDIEITSDEQFVAILESFFTYIKDNDRMFRILITQSDNRVFNRRLIDAVLRKYHVESQSGNPLLAKYEYVFIISGVIGLLGAWMEGNYPISARKFSEMVLKMGLKAAEIEHSDFRLH